MNRYILTISSTNAFGSVPDNIRAEMRRKRVTMHELAKLLRVSIGYVQRRLSGTYDLSLSDIQRIADLLEVHVLVLLFNPVNVSQASDAAQPSLAVSA